MRRLIVCCDGTWNSKDNMDGRLRAPTNVVKFHAEIADVAADGVVQIPYYRTGVGTLGNPLLKAIDGAFGTRLENDIQSAYKFLAETYQPGDEIYILGFSRGAYSARSLAGVIGVVGLCDLTDPAMSDKVKWDNAKAAVLRFKLHKSNGAHVVLQREKKNGLDYISSSIHAPDVAKIKFLGVWDTVGSLGIPDDFALTKLVIGDPRANQFLDTSLGKNVQVARHALAIDEQRIDFTPTLWTSHGDETDVEQVWFSGVHGDVGGGYADHALGDLSLKWMMQEAQKLGLAFRAGALGQIGGDPQGRLHESVTGVFKQRPTRPRRIPDFQSTKDDLTYISTSAVDRHRRPALGEEDYWDTVRLQPQGPAEQVRVHAREHWVRTGIYVKKGETYAVTARGAWRDADIEGGPDGASRQWGIGYGLAMIPEGYRALFRKMKRGKTADNTFSRRADGKWFALIGVIANGRGVDPASQLLAAHQTLVIGSQATFVAQDDGYLYFFANDAWRFYRNNSGALSVEVTRP